MFRYFFDIREHGFRDEEGRDFANLKLASLEGARLLAEVIKDRPDELLRNRTLHLDISDKYAVLLTITVDVLEG